MGDANSFYEEFQFKDNTQNTFSYTSHPRVSSELDLKEKAIYHGRTVPLYQIKRLKPCECGSRVNIVDEIHGEVLCPTCGQIHYQMDDRKF